MATTTISRSQQIRPTTGYAWIANDSAGVMTDFSITANRAIATDANGSPIASATTATQLGYLSTTTSDVQTQINGKLSTTLTSAHLFVGNGSNVATDVVVSGDLTLANTGAFTIANAAVTGAKIASATITNTNLATGVFGAITGLGTQTQTLDMGSNLISNVADPVGPQDAATKFYVDSISAGLDPKASCNTASLLNVPGYATSPNNGTFTIPNNNATYFPNAGQPAVVDGIDLANGDRVLVKNQTDPKQNGIYSVTNAGVEGTTDAVLTRSTDMDGTPANEVSGGNFTFVENGTQAGTGWVIVWDGTVVLNTDPINWTQFSDAGSIVYVAGAGMTQTGSTTVTFNVVSANTGITVNTDDIALTLNSVSGLEISTGLRIKSDTVTADTIGTTITANGAGMKFDANSFVDSGSETLSLAAGVAGAALSLTTGVLSVNVDNSTIEVNSDALRVKAGGITNNEVSASAAIAFSKLAPLTSANILVGNGSNVATSVAVTGDVSLTNAGVTSISSGIAAHLVTREVPSGTINGSNPTFTLAFTPTPVGSEMIFKNGILQNAGGSNDYTISGATITFNAGAIPESGSVLLVTYWK